MSYTDKMLHAISEVEQARAFMARIVKDVTDKVTNDHLAHARANPRYARRAQGQEIGWRISEELTKDLDYQDQTSRRNNNTQFAIMYGVAALLLEPNVARAKETLSKILGGQAA
jgi:hypothetical protein